MSCVAAAICCSSSPTFCAKAASRSWDFACHLHDLLALARLATQLIERDLSAGLIVSHWLSPLGLSVYVTTGNRLAFRSAGCSTDHGGIGDRVIVDRPPASVKSIVLLGINSVEFSLKNGEGGYG